MLKKILAITLGLVMALGMTSLFACGGTPENPAFNSETYAGSYKEVTTADLTELATKVSTNTNATVKDYIKDGYKLTMALGSGSGDTYMNAEMELKATLSADNKLALQATAKADSAMKDNTGKKLTLDADANAWYVDGAVYVDASVKMPQANEPMQIKGQTAIALETMVDGYVGAYMDMELDIADYIIYLPMVQAAVQSLGSDKISFLIDMNDNGTKIKFDINNLTMADVAALMPAGLGADDGGYGVLGGDMLPDMDGMLDMIPGLDIPDLDTLKTADFNIDAEIVLVLDNELNIEGFKIILAYAAQYTEGNVTYKMNESLKIALDKFTETITAPADADTYTQLPADFLAGFMG